MKLPSIPRTIFLMVITFNHFLLHQLNAQAPAKIPYQAVARDVSGNALNNSTVDARFSIREATADGPVLWQEQQTTTTNGLGLFTVQLGGVTPITGIDWSSGAKFMQIEVDLGQGFVLIGTQQLLSVPYALFSDQSSQAGNGFSSVGEIGDTLFFNNGDFLIVPGISAANNTNQEIGCTDVEACNYSASAVVDNNTCQYAGGFCDDGNPNTFNDSYSVDCSCNGIVSVPEGSHFCGAQNVHNPEITYGTMTDQDGNLYKTVIIGTQEWMAENLRVSSFRNGSPLVNLTSSLDWSAANNISEASWVYYANDSLYNCPYGKLYNKYAVTNNSNGLCPFGWHIPTESEWVTLINYLDFNAVGGNVPNDAGGKLKSAGTFFWSGTNTGGSNVSGFSALPGGYRSSTGVFLSEGINGYYWTNSNISNSSSYYVKVFGNSTESVTSGSGVVTSGFSVRCVRD
jgi:uncharacterized protein (TIGR02145 family)